MTEGGPSGAGLSTSGAAELRDRVVFYIGRSWHGLSGGEGGTASERTGPGAAGMRGSWAGKAGRGWHGPHGMGGGVGHGRPWGQQGHYG